MAQKTMCNGIISEDTITNGIAIAVAHFSTARRGILTAKPRDCHNNHELYVPGLTSSAWLWGLPPIAAADGSRIAGLRPVGIAGYNTGR